MTENEAIKGLETLKYQCKHNGECGTCNICCSSIPLAIQALEQIQLYRAIGTIEEFKSLKEKNETLKALYEDARKEGNNLINKAIDEVLNVVNQKYHNFSGYDLAFMQKYGNTTASQQYESYSTLMMYEIAGEFENMIDIIESLKAGGENEID